jgi:GntR family transcriptional regulator
LIRGQFTISEVEGQKVEQTISAALIDESIADALQATPGDAALVISRWHRHPSGRLVSIGVHTHPSDRYAITYHL